MAVTTYGFFRAMYRHHPIMLIEKYFILQIIQNEIFKTFECSKVSIPLLVIAITFPQPEQGTMAFTKY